jgi:hypothetical protein
MIADTDGDRNGYMPLNNDGSLRWPTTLNVPVLLWIEKILLNATVCSAEPNEVMNGEWQRMWK